MPALAVLFALSGCGGGEDRLVVCTSVLRYAVLVEPVDEQGRALVDVQVHWRVNGGSTQNLRCTLAPCGVDKRQGRYQLSASKAGYASASTEILVDHDDCHALTERWRPVLHRQ